MSHDISREVRDKLRARLSPEVYAAWCRDLRLEPAGAGAFRIPVPNAFYGSFLERTLGPHLRRALEESGVRDPRLEFSAAPAPSLPAAPPPAAPTGPAETLPVGYAEVNFARLPFSLVNDKEIRVAREILIDQTVRARGEAVRRVWRVTAGAAGMPGPFDHAVFRALEKFALDTTIRRGAALQNPIFFNLKTIIDALELYYNTQNLGFVSRALKRLQEISVEDLGLYETRDRRRKGVTRKMHLIDTVKAAGDVLPSGSVRGTHAVFFGQEYVESVNARYIRPLDWDLWLGLNRPISRRLVEILDTDFYGLRHARHVAYSYAELCQLIPVKPQRYLSKGRGILDPAHEELVEKGYLEYAWDVADRNFPRLLYTPGERWRRFQARLGHGGQVSEDARALARELGEPDRASFYQQIVERVDRQYLNEALQDLRARLLAGHPPANPAAWFLGTLKDILTPKGLPLFPLR